MTTQLATGQTLSGRYQIVNQLGRGGFGRTFLARDLYLPTQPQCVVKQLQPSANDPDTLQVARRLFDTEAQILHQLGTHPQIPQLFAYFEENKEFYLVEEYIDGHELARELNSHQTKSEENVIELIAEILEILVFVHQQNVIHRDINPYNIIRRKKDDKLTLIDFGAVKQITTQMVRSGKTSYTIAIGTPGYFPSEQAIGSPKFSSDIYAVGILGIQALTGRSPEQIPVDPQTGEINWHSLIKVSPGLTNVLNKMVSYDFRDRYFNAAEALKAVRELTSPVSGKTIAVVNHNVSHNVTILPRDRIKQIKKWAATSAISLSFIASATFSYIGINHFLASNNAFELYKQGNTFYNLKDYDRALENYEKAIAIRPEYAEAWQKKGDALQSLNRDREALESYEKAIQIQPNNWQAWVGRAQIFAQQGRSQEASETFQKAIEIESDAVEAWQGLVRVQMKLKQYSQAIVSCDRLLKLEPDNTSAWYQKGWAAQNLREYKQAIESYDKAVDIQPDFSSAWYQKGNVLMILQEYKQASESYEKAVQFQPNLSQAWYSQGIALSKLGRNEEAINAYSQATKVKSNYAEAWYQKGWTLHQLKRYEEAVSAYETVIRLQPSDSQAWYNQGNVHYNLGNYEKAIASYKQTVSLKKDFYQAWYSQGNALYQLKRYEEAINAYERALRYQPDYRPAKEGKAKAESSWQAERQKQQLLEIPKKIEDLIN